MISIFLGWLDVCMQHPVRSSLALCLLFDALTARRRAKARKAAQPTAGYQSRSLSL